MDSVRRLLLLLMLLAVNASEDSEFNLQREVRIPTELLDMVKQGSLDSHPVRKTDRQISLIPFIPFPLARPTTGNILAICHYSNLRPRYTKDMLPKSGFGYLYRQASAVNQLESWFSVCCSNGTQDEEMTLCCAQQAWKISLSNFCQEEFSIKTSHYHCCKKNQQARWDCFEENAPDPLYQPSGQKVSPTQDFDFNASSCQKTSVSEIIHKPEMVTEPLPHGLMGQRMVITQNPVSLGEEDLLHHHVPSHQFIWPTITFPLARPTTTNIHAICQYSNYRPRHSKDALPSSGFGYLHRQASAVNQLESWYTVCCSNITQDVEQTLCCAQQAWETSLSAFCEEEFSIKTSHYHCCKKNGLERWDCFEKEASNMSYKPSESEAQFSYHDMQNFDFDLNSCQKTSISEVITKRQIKTELISFPPGRPNADNISPICAFRKYRPRFITSCLPPTGFDWFGHQLKAINSLEKGFGHCCKENKHIKVCAEDKWKKMVDRFCKDEKKKNQENQYECCNKQRGEEQYGCFSTAAPNPQYMVMNDNLLLEDHASLDMFCGTYRALQKMKHLPFNVDEMAENCCILVGAERSTCLQIQMDIHLDDACKADNPSVTQVKQNCCRKAANERSRCLTKLLLHNIAKAIRINRRRCPIVT
ncbi:extracellular matrix protein 1 isoform X2 [Hemibagrus wyckioides]|uniref:extracellular matrix protein 1 isoform X2 n=1 Tax=Hemibagrus wyckioides TaxID=337641 RepID=UPI00266B3BD2|nr:extracellular matrix protein 1 isoform X2 [Hemibagrus wyckioides]